MTAPKNTVITSTVPKVSNRLVTPIELWLNKAIHESTIKNRLCRIPPQPNFSLKIEPKQLHARSFFDIIAFKLPITKEASNNIANTNTISSLNLSNIRIANASSLNGNRIPYRVDSFLGKISSDTAIRTDVCRFVNLVNPEKPKVIAKANNIS